VAPVAQTQVVVVAVLTTAAQVAQVLLLFVIDFL
jgi:hypothetical protein